MKILDIYNHQGHQYEFSKINKEILLVGLNEKKADWDIRARPLLPNVKTMSLTDAIKKDPDVLIWRRGANYKWYKRLVQKGAKCIGVAQTTYLDYMVPNFVKILVWNSKDAMEKLHKNYPWCEHVHIVHGFDPNEFKNLSLSRIDGVLSVNSKFLERRKILGLDNFRYVASKIKKCHLYGHGNEEMPESRGSLKTFADLVKIYNAYKIYLNTTVESAMPRSRAEAMMCGTPLVTTSNYDIRRYINQGVNGYLADSPQDMVKFCKRILESRSHFEDLSNASRETAITHFHIDNYIKKWNQVLN